jgi:hypothetical protein
MAAEAIAMKKLFAGWYRVAQLATTNMIIAMKKQHVWRTYEQSI